MRPFDCEAVLALRLGQSQDDVRALIGKPYLEEAGETWWEKERVADYRMLFEDLGRRRWLEGSVDLSTLTFSGIGWSEQLLIALASGRIASLSLLGRKATVSHLRRTKAEIGPAFREVFQCGAGVPLEKAQAEFEAQVKAR
jgi:hypothetical protein